VSFLEAEVEVHELSRELTFVVGLAGYYQDIGSHAGLLTTINLGKAAGLYILR